MVTVILSASCREKCQRGEVIFQIRDKYSRFQKSSLGAGVDNLSSTIALRRQMYFHHCLLLEFIFETVFELTRISLPYSLHPFSNSVSQLFQPGWKRKGTLLYSQVQLLED